VELIRETTHWIFALIHLPAYIVKGLTGARNAPLLIGFAYATPASALGTIATPSLTTIGPRPGSALLVGFGAPAVKMLVEQHPGERG
jgi:hypothetical protein